MKNTELELLTDTMDSIDTYREAWLEVYSASYGQLYNYDDDLDVDTETPWFEQGVFVDMDMLVAMERGEIESDYDWYS